MNQRKIHIAFVQPSLCYGGVEKVLINLLKALDYERYSVDLYLLEKDDTFLDQVPGNVTVRYISDSDPASPHPECGIGVVYDTVIAFQGIFTRCLETALYCFCTRKRIAWIHGDLCFGDADISLYDGFDRIICVSQGVRERFVQKAPMYIGKTMVVNNLLDAREIMQKADRTVTDMNAENFSIVTVARLEEEKGVSLIPKTASALKEDGYSFCWFVVGDGILKEQMAAEIRKYQLDGSVILTGWKINPYPYMRMADLYVQPSFSEGYCTTTNEARCLCKPVVTTDVPGMREQFHQGRSCFIVDTVSARALADGIEYMIDNPEQRKQYEDFLKNNRDSDEEKLKIICGIIGDSENECKD